MLWLPKWLREPAPISADSTSSEGVSRRTFLFLAGGAAASLVLPAPPADPLVGSGHGLLAWADDGAFVPQYHGVSRVLFAGGRRGGKTALVNAYLELCAPDGLRYPSAELSPSQAKEHTWQSVDRNPKPSFWVHPPQRQFWES